MQVRFWGARGSIPKCGPQILRYGGSTPCIEVLTDAGTLIVIDCGSGGHGSRAIAPGRRPRRQGPPSDQPHPLGSHPGTENRMRFVSFERGGRKALAAARHDEWRGLAESYYGFPGTLQMLIEAGGTALVTAGKALASAPKVQLDEVTLLPPISSGEKIICVGLNYKDHSSESGFKQPEYPTIFGRFNSSLIAHGAPI